MTVSKYCILIYDNTQPLITGMVCCSTRIESPHACIYGAVSPLSWRVGDHVHLNNIPLDFRHLDILFYHGYGVGVLDSVVNRVRGCLWVEFRKRSRAIP